MRGLKKKDWSQIVHLLMDVAKNPLYQFPSIEEPKIEICYKDKSFNISKIHYSEIVSLKVKLGDWSADYHFRMYLPENNS